MSTDSEREQLCLALVSIALRVRDQVRAALSPEPATAGADFSGTADRSTPVGLSEVVRAEGGDHIFGVDDVADRLIVEALPELAARWPGQWIMEGYDSPLAVGDADGPWRYLCDPLDGTRPLLVDKRSAWVLIGAGRNTRTLEELELSVVVEVPNRRAGWAMVAWADRDGHLDGFDEDLRTGRRLRLKLRPRQSSELDHTFVTVVRFAPGYGEAIGRWADKHLAGLATFDDLVPCSGGQLMGLASGADAAVFDPRPILGPGTMAAHPYDLAGLWVAHAAGAIVEALPTGPLDIPLSVDHPVAWAGYANAAIAERLRVLDCP